MRWTSVVVVGVLVAAGVASGAGTAYAATPVAYDGYEQATEGVPLDITLYGEDVDEDPLTFAIGTAPADGSLGSIGAPSCQFGFCEATVTYTADAGTDGSDSFTFTVNDGTATSAPATVSIDIVGPAAPEAFDDFVEAETGATTTITLNGADDNEDPLTFAIVTPPTGGTLGTIGTPDCSAGFCSADVDYTDSPAGGDDSFTFTVNDGTTTSPPATIDISVVAAPCSGAIISNGTVQLGVNCIGDLNVPGSTPSSETGTTDVGLRLVSTNSESTAPGCLCEGWGAADDTTDVTGYANEARGTSNVSVVSFTSDADSATSKVAIGSTLEVTHDYQPSTATDALYTVTVSVKNTSASPVHLRYRRVMDWDVEPTAFNEFSTVQTGNASEIVFTSNDGFATADALAGPSDLGSTGNFTDAGPDDHGALFDFDFGSLAAGSTKTFATFYGAAGTETAAAAALSAVDAEAYSFGQPSTPDGATAGTPNTFIFAFAGVGGTPVFAPDAVNDALTTSANTANSVDVLANDTDPNGDSLTVTTASPVAAHGTVSCASTGSCVYTPTAGYSGPDSFTYSISDGHGGTDSATVSVTVNPAGTNNPPVADDETLTTPEDTPGNVSVLVGDTDPDGDPLSVSGWTNGSHGTVSCTGPGVCTYTPQSNYHGPDSFTYTVSDGKGGTDTATVTVTVTPVNDPPVVAGNTLTTPQNTPGGVAVLGNDSDPDGDSLVVSTWSNGVHGTVSCTAAGLCTYTPAAGYTGSDSFTYTASDGHGGTAVATVTVTVTPVSVPPAVDVRIEKLESADPVPVGNLFSYRLVASNASTATATGVVVSDPLPAGFKLRDVAPSMGSCTVVGATVTCQIGELPAGGSATVTVNGAFVAAGTKTNTATVSARGDANGSNDAATSVTTVTGQTCTVVGTFGDDNPLHGTNKADVICGLSGDDRINGKQGDDTIYGNDGNDRLNGLGGDDRIDGGPGTDTITYAALQQSVRVNLGLHKSTGQGADTLISIENATGSPGDDLLTGSAGRNRLSGGGGADRLAGLGGADALLGGAGHDRLDGGAGKDALNGGVGGDTCRTGGGGGSKKSC